MPDQLTLRLHHFLPASRANGPGVRAVVWVQGCTLGCPGCFNPATHALVGGQEVRAVELAGQIIALEGQVQGLTVSGGEPFQQAEALAAVCRALRRHSELSIVVFTGFEMDELSRLPHSQAVVENIDVLIAGRYRQEQRLGKSLRGSANKRMIFLTKHYQEADFLAVPEAEVILTPQGETLLSGIDPLKLV